MRKTTKSPWKIIGAVILIVIVLVIMQRSSLSDPVKNVFIVIGRPAQNFFTTAAQQFKQFFWYFRNNKNTQDENSQLKNTIAQLLVENERLKESVTDNLLLQQETNYLDEHNLAAVTAKIIGTSSDNYSQVLLINQGSSAGIKAGDPVIVNNGIIIGKIIEVQQHLSKILLLNDNRSQISAVIQNDSKSPGMVNGQYSLTLHMDLIPQDQAISQDQLVITSGLEEGIPPDLIIGKITSTTKQEGELFQQASVAPLISYNTVSIVSVIIPK
jgi:rod shape-determining protein MreC